MANRKTVSATAPHVENVTSNVIPISKPSKDSLITKAALVFLGLLPALIIAEIIVRLYWQKLTAMPQWSDRPATYYAPVDSPNGGDYFYSNEKPANTFRIVTVGDSFTFPPYMQFDDAYPKRLERMLNLNTAESAVPHAEVINFGRWGASSIMEVPTVQRAITDGADLVLLEITLNDPERRPFKDIAKKSKGRYVFGPLEISPEKNPLYYYWRTLGLIATRLHNDRTHESVIRYHQELFSNEKTWNRFSSALTQMHKDAQAHNVRLAAFIFPFLQYPLDNHYPFQEAHQKIGSLLDSLKVPHTDLLPAFQGIPMDRLVVLPGRDGHPNEIAHRIAAEQVYNWLVQEKLIPQELVIKDTFVHRGAHAKKEPSLDSTPN